MTVETRPRPTCTDTRFRPLAAAQNNLFPPHRDIHETYDLKGSSVGREYPEDKARLKKGAVMKDINWVRRSRELRLGPEKRALLTEQLRRDTDFLQRMHILDYSLLIGIHNMQRGNRDLVRQNTLQVFDVRLSSTTWLVHEHPVLTCGSSPSLVAAITSGRTRHDATAILGPSACGGRPGAAQGGQAVGPAGDGRLWPRLA